VNVLASPMLPPGFMMLGSAWVIACRHDTASRCVWLVERRYQLAGICSWAER
jgi:hypothetical protein